MKKPSAEFLLFFSLLLGSTAQAREITDATGVKVNVAERPSRVVTLAPSLSELAADLLGEGISRIVGVSEFSDYPPVLKKVPSIGSYASFSIESVVGLRPDLVLATHDGNSLDQIQHLRELGVPVLVVSTGTFGEVENSIRLVAHALGADAEGMRMAGQFKTGLAHIREKARKHPKRKVLLQVGADPLVVVGKTSFLNDAIEAIGAENLYGDAISNYPRPALEDAVARNPDVIVILMMGTESHGFEKMALPWNRFPRMNAVRDHQIRLLRADPLVRPTLRLLEGLSLLERAVYGQS